MRSGFITEDIVTIHNECCRMLEQLKYTWKSNIIDDNTITYLGENNTHKIYLLLKQSRNGVVKVTIELDLPVRKIADYEKRKHLESSFLNSLTAFIDKSEPVFIGV